MFRCCWDLVKFLLFIVNFAAFVVIGLALAGSIYALVDPQTVLGFHVRTVLHEDNPTAIYFILIITCVVVFGFLFLFTFLGCCGSACQNRCMLGSFIIILFVFLGANVAGIVYMYLEYPNGEMDLLAAQLDKTIAYYKADDPDSISKKFWDFLQPELRCCGASTIYDWGNAQLKAGRKVPASCCNARRDQASECVYNPSIDNGAYMTSCVDVLESAWRVAFWMLPSVMALMLVLALIVCTRNDSRNVDDYREGRNRREPSRNRDYYTEDPGYVYRASTPNYPTAPPYNEGYDMRYMGGHRGAVDQYPTGVIPPETYSQPLMSQPPPYHDVVSRKQH